MNEVMIQTHTGDNVDDIINTALEIVKIKTVSYVVFSFNGVKLFVKKNSDKESVLEEYNTKLQAY
jgi:hypothetical protein